MPRKGRVFTAGMMFTASFLNIQSLRTSVLEVQWPTERIAESEDGQPATTGDQS